MTATDDFLAIIGHRSPRYLIPRPAWHARAACRGQTAVFYARDTTAAEAICTTCPVIDPCRNASLDGPDGTPETDGVWAGTTAADRKRIGRDLAA